jgi:hypothetical protein
LSELDALDAASSPVSTSVTTAAGRLLRHGDVRIPTRNRAAVDLTPLTPQLHEALAVLTVLDREVSTPWTLIGGLMVLVTCAEHGANLGRATVDADVVVGVFTHRHALRRLTSCLSHSDFHDDSPDPATGGERLAYRWRRGAVTVDVTVPPKVNDQEQPPTAVGGRKAVELPGTQKALRRTERIPVSLPGGNHGHLRRPDLLGAIVLKSVAAVSDRRDPQRHREDLVVLADLLARTGRHLTYRPWLRLKDRRRITAALGLVTEREWRRASDAEAARGALVRLVQPMTDA